MAISGDVKGHLELLTPRSAPPSTTAPSSRASRGARWWTRWSAPYWTSSAERKDDDEDQDYLLRCLKLPVPGCQFGGRDQAGAWRGPRARQGRERDLRPRGGRQAPLFEASRRPLAGPCGSRADAAEADVKPFVLVAFALLCACAAERATATRCATSMFATECSASSDAADHRGSHVPGS